MITNACPLCGNTEHAIISTRGKEIVAECPCEVWYKQTIDETKKTKHYKKSFIWDKEFFENRYKKISKYLWEKIGRDGRILDIGCGNGRMLDRLHGCFTKSALTGNEASAPLFKSIKYPLIKGRFDDADFKAAEYDLIVCMGVDYLFLDHAKAMQKIASLLAPDGRLYIERNVFKDMKSFYGKTVTTIDVLLWKNLLITTWFTEDQMEKQLDKYFNRIDKIEYGEPITRCVGWLCSLR